jgi:hypothetical protein
LGQDPFTPAELDAIEREYVLALDRYGTNFRSQNGWASEYVKKGNPNFADLEIAAGVDHLRPYYKLASHNVHANPKGVLFKLGFFGDANTLLAGPSNAGLADPGHSTAISLNQISATILHFFPSFDNIIAVKVMSLLADTIGKEFLKAHKQLEQDELDRRAQTVPSRRGKRGRHKDRRKKARSKQSG